MLGSGAATAGEPEPMTRAIEVVAANTVSHSSVRIISKSLLAWATGAF
jgi:hypothetical protein